MGVRAPAASARTPLGAAWPAHRRSRRALSPLAHSRLQSMLRRKPTRIELKPDDREEYFEHKQNKQEPGSENKEKPSEKDVRIGLAKPR